MKHTVTLIPGDGIGPEIVAATVRIIEASGIDVAWETHILGAQALEKFGTTLPEATTESIKKNKVALKGPQMTPVGKGFTSVNVGLRKALDLYANVRPIKTLPNVPSRYTDVDVVIVRENTEGLYSGLEHTVIPGVVESLKIVTEKASTRISPLRVRICAVARAKEGHLCSQGEHHEALGRPVPGVLRKSRDGVSGDRGRQQDRRQLLHAACYQARAV